MLTLFRADRDFNHNVRESTTLMTWERPDPQTYHQASHAWPWWWYWIQALTDCDPTSRTIWIESEQDLMLGRHLSRAHTAVWVAGVPLGSEWYCPDKDPLLPLPPQGCDFALMRTARAPAPLRRGGHLLGAYRIEDVSASAVMEHLPGREYERLRPAHDALTAKATAVHFARLNGWHDLPVVARRL